MNGPLSSEYGLSGRLSIGAQGVRTFKARSLRGPTSENLGNALRQDFALYKSRALNYKTGVPPSVVFASSVLCSVRIFNMYGYEELAFMGECQNCGLFAVAFR